MSNIDIIIRDVCELQYDGDFNEEDMVAATITDLRVILERHLAATVASAAPTDASSAPADELPPLPEMDGLQDIPYALNTPDDWDADYANTWSSLQVAERNKMQWRVYALKLRDMLSKSISGGDAERQHVAYAEGGKLHWMTGRKLMECELYTAPSVAAAIAAQQAAAGPNAALVEALKKIEANQTGVFDEDLGEDVLVCMDSEEMVDVARAALASLPAKEGA